MGTSHVGGMSGMGMTMPPDKISPPATGVLGASGGAPVKQITPASLGGGPGDAASGAASISAVLAKLSQSLEQLKSAVQMLAQSIAARSGAGNLTGGGSFGTPAASTGVDVAGVFGAAALRSQFVGSPVASATGGSEQNAFEQRVLDLINQERTSRGLRPVAYNAVLDTAATKHNRQMSLTHTMAHDGIGDGDPGERIRAEGYRNAWGENVATGQTSPEQVVREWMNSPDHRRNILDPNYTQMGVAYQTDSNGRSFWAQEFGA